MARRTPSEYIWGKLQFDETILTKHFTKGRLKLKPTFVVVHHMTIVGDGKGKANDACYRVWQTRKASAHYGVDGTHVRQFVWDSNTAWSTGNTIGNRRGISIEHANSEAGPKWKISDTTWRTGAKLAAHIHVVHGLGRPTSTKDGKGGTLRKHSSFKATACPGPYMDAIWDTYVAEAQRVYDVLINKKPTKPAPVDPVIKTRYEVTSNSLNGRSGPGMQHSVKAVRKKGFRFNSSKRSGNWVQASKYWYHVDHLKDVTTPPKKVNLRLGTLNIPLDARKIEDGGARAKVAAKQINASNLDIIACQELDRDPKGEGHTYATMLLTALGKDWTIVRPKTKFNENYTFVKKGNVVNVAQLPDKTLTSSAGGRHATRVTITKGGRAFTILNTHLVSGKDNGPSRESQGSQLAEIAGPSTFILGDLNQKEVPKALMKSHKTARDHAKATTNAIWGTFSKWGNKRASKAATAFKDHILAPREATVEGYTVVGLNSSGVLDQPRASDHLLVIASITI